MNSAKQASRTEQTAEHVSAEVVVELESCTTQDAHAVFSALRTSFSSDRAADDVPEEVAGPGSTVWTTTFDVSELKAEAGPRRLTAPVAVSVQGGYWAVDQLSKALASAFTVHLLGMAAGDQEKEVELRLESRG
ncbi:hypothetical protein SSP35_04_01310 [Streptomyces sp. NBRC 110611]|uniref:hypothetical protein n=1 Tax=Streptomyces sp. NBRC 110611 TaxID=1621259 RepID=UPI0008337D8D|nr:hypothetical protein [Streptomyces sp. NBRC 110611]GAU67050.1 hypothetical protein SSP35_04_01310 [Streptomyces sp. NBRC 110611]